MTASIARYLKDFGEPQPVAPLLAPQFDIGGLSDGMANDMSGGFAGGMADDFDFAAEAETPAIDVEAERAEAHAQGFEAARAQLQARFDEEKQTLDNAYAAEIAALRERFEQQVAETIEAGLNRIAATVASAVSEKTAAALAPLIEASLAHKAAEELADMIRSATLEGDVGTVIVTGPVEMFARLQAALGGDTPLLRHVVADDLDLSVDIDGSVLVTRLSAWAASLRKVLG